MVKDRFLKAMDQMLTRWKKVKEKRIIVNSEINFSPQAIFISLKHCDFINITGEDGGLTSDPKSSYRLDVSTRVTVAVGDSPDDPKGNGLGISSSHAFVSPENIKALKNVLDKLIDGAFKESLAEYFGHHSVVSELDIANTRFMKLSNESESPVEYFEKEKEFQVNIQKLSEIIEKATQTLHAQKEIEESDIVLSFSRENRRFAAWEKTVQGETKKHIFTSQTLGHIVFSASVRDAGGRLVEYSKRIVTGVDLETLSQEEKIMKATYELIEMIKQRSNCQVHKSGRYKTVLDSHAVGTLLHEAGMAHLLSGRYIDEEGATTFKDNIGERILPNFITIYDDPTIPNGSGSFKYDEEGVEAQRTVIVEKGVLINLLHDRISAGRRRTRSNGKARAEGSKTPEPRTSNLIVESSISYPKEKIIQMMLEDCKKDGDEYGLLIEGGGGEVNVESGEFRLFPNTVWRIYTDGRREPVSSALFIPLEALQALNSIKAVSNEKEIVYGVCGAESGYVPVQEICPAAYVGEIPVHSASDDPPRRRLLPKIKEEDDSADFEENDN